MYSNQFHFLKFLNYLINFDNSKYYQNISKISSSDPINYKKSKLNKILVNSDTKILNIEKCIQDYYAEKTSPAIVDGLYFNFNKNNKLSIFCIEFKGDKLDKQSWKDFFKDNILSLQDNICSHNESNCPIRNLNFNSLNTLYDHYSDEMVNQLQIKPLETLFIALPELYENYLESNFDKVDLISNHFNCYVYVIHVDSTNPSNTYITTKNEVEDKYSLYTKRNLIKSYKIYSNEDFKNNFIPKIDLFPLSFIDIIVVIVESMLKSNFGGDIDEMIDNLLCDELNNRNLCLNDKQKKKLHKLIFYFYSIS